VLFNRSFVVWCGVVSLVTWPLPVLPPVAQPQLTLSDAYMCAKTFFDVGEYQRAAHTIEAARAPAAADKAPKGQAARPNVSSSLSHEERFLRAYALYLAGEKVGATVVVRPPVFLLISLSLCLLVLCRPRRSA
jgi:hypothetical protein